MVTLHIHVPASKEFSPASYASQEDLYVRSEMISSYLGGDGSLPAGVSLDMFSGEMPFCLLSPRGYRWEKGDPAYIFTFHASSFAHAAPETIMWAVHLMEEDGIPVFLLPLPETEERKPGRLPLLYRNVERMEKIIPSMRRNSSLLMVCHGKTYYEGLLTLIRDSTRRKKILPVETHLVSLFGGDAFACSDPVIPDRKDLQDTMRKFSGRISVIALTNDRRVRAADILRSWMDGEGNVSVKVDLVKPAFPADRGLFACEELMPEEEGISVMQKTRHYQQLRLEVTWMICSLLTEHTRKQLLKKQY